MALNLSLTNTVHTRCALRPRPSGRYTYCTSDRDCGSPHSIIASRSDFACFLLTLIEWNSGHAWYVPVDRRRSVRVATLPAGYHETGPRHLAWLGNFCLEVLRLLMLYVALELLAWIAGRNAA